MVRNITGTDAIDWAYSYGGLISNGSNRAGAFTAEKLVVAAGESFGGGNTSTHSESVAVGISFSASIVVPTDIENRPYSFVALPLIAY